MFHIILGRLLGRAIMNPKIVAVAAAGVIGGKMVRATIRRKVVDPVGRRVTAKLKKKVYDEEDQQVAEIYEDDNKNEYLYVHGQMHHLDADS